MTTPISFFLTGAMLLFLEAHSQHAVRYTYYNDVRTQVKTRYYVVDTINNVAHGEYTSYFRGGNVQSKGSFDYNRPVGKWKFFYESGELKMVRFPLEDSRDHVRMVYYYRSGKKSMEGEIRASRREGLWEMYTEEGNLKSKITYEGAVGRCVEYYPSGNISGEGLYKGTQKVGLWHYFAQDKTLISEGFYEQGKKEGEWKYFSKNGTVSSKGNYSRGKESGEWQLFDADGNLEILRSFKTPEKEEVVIYYPTGEVKAMGSIEYGNNQGVWTYFYRDGKKKGTCDFNRGSGIYFGYSPEGRVQTKGHFKDNLQAGIWEVYDDKGALVEKDSVSNVDESVLSEKNFSKEDTKGLEEKPASKPTYRIRGHYFSSNPLEYRGLIAQINPFFTLIGRLPIALEFYDQDRLGHEFLFDLVRNPFFKLNSDMNPSEMLTQGYSIAIRQKFYNPFKFGLWYFGHTIVFTSLLYSSIMNMGSLLSTVSASEIKIEYGVLLGSRLMRSTKRNGLTVDAYVGITAGYRHFTTSSAYKEAFSALKQDPFAYTFRFGINFGYVLSVNR